MTSKFSDLDQPITIQFDRIFIDPNNPRIAEERDTRYDQPDEIFDPDLQKALTERTYDVYNAKKLEDTIVAQGWIPIDPIIVWEHPGRRGHYVVVEGNTRTSVLRTIRESTLPREQAKLERFEKRRKAPAEEVQRQKRHVARLKSIIDGTDILTVYPVNASTTEELEKRLPRVMGVRHISHAQQWGPYAQNLYILSLYRRLFAERYGADMPLRLEQDLIERVASMVSLGETKTRRNIQAASAFGHFKLHYEDQLPKDEQFSDQDHYFFENILQHKYAQEQFDFTKDRLHLSDEAEQALFVWAFSKSRHGGEDKNQNIFYKAENIRLWSAMARYDSSNGTSFASQFDVSAPESSTKSMQEVEADYLQHRAQRTPLKTLQSLLQALKELKGETMIVQAEFLKPTLKEIANVTNHYLRMMEADTSE